MALPNSVIGYYFDKDIVNYFKHRSIVQYGFEAKGENKFHVQLFVRLFYEVEKSNIFEPVAGNGKFSHFYATYRDMAEWKDNGIRVKAMNLIRNPEAQKLLGFTMEKEVKFWMLKY